MKRFCYSDFIGGAIAQGDLDLARFFSDCADLVAIPWGKPWSSNLS
jgi:hypothetical protein